MTDQTRAILGAQWRMLLNFYRRHGQVSLIIAVLLSAIWYGGFAGIAVFLANGLATAAAIPLLHRYAGPALFFVFVYWQGMPLMMASFGGLLDVRKLMAYPIPEQRFFRIEVLLRNAIQPEMPLLMIGTAVGLFRNPGLPKWCAAAPVLYSIFNIFLGVGIRDLLGRLLANKRVREIAIFLLILTAALPQLLIQKWKGWKLGRLADMLPSAWLPWSAAGKAASGAGDWKPWVALTLFAIAAWAFGRWQFHRTLRSDPEAGRAAETAAQRSRLDFLWSWPNLIFRDPLAALVEKEIRFLSRISRFRIVFFMGFSFGLLIWLPMASRNEGGWVPANFLSVVSAYALLLLSDTCFYNCFGFDRTAAQFYYIAPVKKATVLAAKNIAAAFFVVAEIGLVTVACVALRMPVTLQKIAEASAVCCVTTLFFLAIGNLGSTRSPRAQNPNDGWKRSGSSRTALFAFAFYPLISLPVGLAFLARYAFDRESAFFVVIGLGAIVAACFYWVSVESAVKTMEEDGEKMLTLLSHSDAPVL